MEFTPLTTTGMGLNEGKPMTKCIIPYWSPVVLVGKSNAHTVMLKMDSIIYLIVVILP